MTEAAESATVGVDGARKIDGLVLVFDATSGPLGAVFDTAKKLLRIRGCALCAITHGALGERSEWRSCRAALGVPVEYFHKDDLPQVLHGKVGDLPCILARVGEAFVPLVEPEVIARCGGSVAELRGKIVYHAARKGLALE